LPEYLLDSSITQDHEVSVLEVSNFSVSFTQYLQGLRQHDLQVISNLSLHVHEGEMLAVVGSSGSGKSLLAEAIMGILPDNAKTSGIVRYRGYDLTPDMHADLNGGHIAYIPQSVNCLDPLMKVGSQVRGTRNSEEAQEAVFARYGLAQTVGTMYPFQLSGGMARRVLLATAVIEDADLIIADEPTPGLTLEQAIEALQNLRELANSGKAVILITHDLDLASSVADKIAVFYAGTTVEVARRADFAGGKLRHPYSRALWDALPQNGFKPLPGFQPYAGELPPGCLFSPRCALCSDECCQGVIAMRYINGGEVRCLHVS
jgi:peptide/nickel transport system ATP-binding protein